MPLTGETKVRLELGIDAQRIMQQVIVNNERIEDQLKKGIELAFEELADENFVELIKLSTKEEVINILKSSVMSWQLKQQIQDKIREKIGQKVDEYTDRIAEEFTKSLK